MITTTWKTLLAGILTAGALTLPAATASSAQEATPECGNGDLTASYRATDAGAGHRYGHLRLKNVSGHACIVQGYGGLSYVGHGDGTQIGAAADRDGTAAPRVVLQPGQRARSLVDEVVAQNYPKRRCGRTHVDGFRVYVPDSTRAQYVEHPTTGCANDRVHLVGHRAYR